MGAVIAPVSTVTDPTATNSSTSKKIVTISPKSLPTFLIYSLLSLCFIAGILYLNLLAARPLVAQGVYIDENGLLANQIRPVINSVQQNQQALTKIHSLIQTCYQTNDIYSSTQQYEFASCLCGVLEAFHFICDNIEDLAAQTTADLGKSTQFPQIDSVLSIIHIAPRTSGAESIIYSTTLYPHEFASATSPLAILLCALNNSIQGGFISRNINIIVPIPTPLFLSSELPPELSNISINNEERAHFFRKLQFLHPSTYNNLINQTVDIINDFTPNDKPTSIQLKKGLPVPTLYQALFTFSNAKSFSSNPYPSLTTYRIWRELYLEQLLNYITKQYNTSPKSPFLSDSFHSNHPSIIKSLPIITLSLDFAPFSCFDGGVNLQSIYPLGNQANLDAASSLISALDTNHVAGDIGIAEPIFPLLTNIKQYLFSPSLFTTREKNIDVDNIIPFYRSTFLSYPNNSSKKAEFTKKTDFLLDKDDPDSFYHINIDKDIHITDIYARYNHPTSNVDNINNKYLTLFHRILYYIQDIWCALWAQLPSEVFVNSNAYNSFHWSSKRSKGANGGTKYDSSLTREAKGMAKYMLSQFNASLRQFYHSALGLLTFDALTLTNIVTQDVNTYEDILTYSIEKYYSSDSRNNTENIPLFPQLLYHNDNTKDHIQKQHEQCIMGPDTPSIRVKNDIISIIDSIELFTRMHSNTHEKLHHSTWLYILASSDNFTTMSKFVPAFVLLWVAIPLFSLYSIFFSPMTVTGPEDVINPSLKDTTKLSRHAQRDTQKKIDSLINLSILMEVFYALLILLLTMILSISPYLVQLSLTIFLCVIHFIETTFLQNQYFITNTVLTHYNVIDMVMLTTMFIAYYAIVRHINNIYLKTTSWYFILSVLLPPLCVMNFAYGISLFLFVIPMLFFSFSPTHNITLIDTNGTLVPQYHSAKTLSLLQKSTFIARILVNIHSFLKILLKTVFFIIFSPITFHYLYYIINQSAAFELTSASTCSYHNYTGSYTALSSLLCWFQRWNKRIDLNYVHYQHIIEEISQVYGFATFIVGSIIELVADAMKSGEWSNLIALFTNTQVLINMMTPLVSLITMMSGAVYQLISAVNPAKDLSMTRYVIENIISTGGDSSAALHASQIAAQFYQNISTHFSLQMIYFWAVYITVFMICWSRK